MGFLDRMVSSAIRRSTGLNVHRAVRGIGAGKLLMMGGAAIAGALAAEKMGKSQPSTAGGRYSSGAGDTVTPAGTPAGTPPPLPPLPAAGPQAVPPLPPLPSLPPLPAIPTSETPVEEEAVPAELLFPLARTMVAAALADGTLAAEERELIDSHLTDGGLSEAQVAQLREEMSNPASVSELVAGVSELAHRQALYRAALLVVRADGEVAASENRWLALLGAALQLDGDHLRELEEDLLGSLRAES